MKKFPSFSQWKQIFKVLKKGEKITLLIFFILTICSASFLATTFYLNNTKQIAAFGGAYTEGIIGQPRFINPIYGETDDIDRTLIDLVYSGLMTYDNNGNIVNDLVKDYTVSGDGRTYTFTLKDNIFWHDGTKLTADDVIFTIKTIQNSDYKSPLRANWVDVEVAKLSETSFSFTLKQSYNSFLENCTVKIIPQHIWATISPENFTLSIYNLQPIGSGPFAFANLTQTRTGFIDTLNLQSNRRYFDTQSLLGALSFKFFTETQDLISSANRGQIDGFAAPAQDTDIAKQISTGWSKTSKLIEYHFALPRYFAVFFNHQNASLFSDINIRKALTQAVNKTELAQTINPNGQQTAIVDSPILPEFYGYQKPTNTLGFDVNAAKTLLDTSGFKEDASGQRSKTIAKKPAFQFTSYLKIGSKGTEVQQLQKCLSGLNTTLKDLLGTQTSGTYDMATENAVTEFQKEYLPDAKPTGETGASTRQQLNTLCIPQSPNLQPLKFTLITINQPQLLQIANLLKNYWQAVGVTIEINAINITDLKPIIKERSYDALLYGESLGMKPDLYPFWYSSQKQDPGLNLSSYENKTVDQLLKDARQTLDESQKAQKLEQLQTTIISEAPALFLYNPDYSYWVSNKIQGLSGTKIADPAKRFVNINNWFIETKRVWK